MEIIMGILNLGRTGIIICMALAALSVASSHADEIDDILDIECVIESKAMNEAAMPLAPDTAAVSPRSAIAPRGNKGDLESRLRETERALSAALMEVKEMKAYCAAQEIRHRRDLQFSHYNMGCVYKASRKYDRAEKEFLAALEIAPDDPATHYNLGILYDDDLGKKDAARKHYKRFIALAPNDADVSKVREWLSLLGE
ncbi:MAG: tetratricopeptide repeat protein [Verrucomicrobia bacterium]|nr:tetratricopeptide repeat protein [Verrucomicrobiota bacterium]